MLLRLATTIVRRRRRVLIGALLVFLAAAVVGGDVAKHLSTGGFEDPRVESTRAEHLLNHRFQQGQPNLLLLVTATSGTVDDAAVARRGAALTQQLAHEPGVAQALSYWSLGRLAPLRSRDNRQALVLARVAGNQDEVGKVVKRISPRYAIDEPGIRVRVGGFGEVFRQVGAQIQHDLGLAEGLSLPIVLVLLVLVFGSVVAASLPLAVGAAAVVGTFLILKMIAAVTDVSIFSLNLTTGMGLGLSVDYSLFVLSRFREETRAGHSTDDAVVRTVLTAGRTVAFSALTVAASLLALLVFPLAFLRSFAFAGIPVVMLAAVGAIVVLPAILAALGPRVDNLALWRRPARADGTGFWHTIAMRVMERPLLIGGSVVVILVLLGTPFLHVHFGLPDDRVLPESASSRQVHDALRSNFSALEAGALQVVAPDVDQAGNHLADIGRYAASLSILPGVARVDAATGSYATGRQVAPPSLLSTRFGSRTGGTWLSVIPGVEPQSKAGERLVHAVRARPSPLGRVLVGGMSARLVDSKASLAHRLPLAGGLIAVITFAVLFLMTGSVVVPAKAVVLNLLSLTATFGAMVWVFQQGHLSHLLSFSATGDLDATTPLLMFCVAFGISMDYEVFLLSRIKEEHDRTGDNVHSVALGLERTGRIVTAAAVLLAVVFLAFGISKVTFIKLFGVGLALAVVMDATLIRATLVPAFMRLAGDANWWAPRPLRRLHDRIGLREHVPAVIDLTAAEPEPLASVRGA